MNYLRQFVATPQGDGAPTGAETIERLCDRVQSSTLLDDRRDAVRALKSLSRKFRLEVGTQAMDVLLNVLKTDRSDSEILGYTLETLCNVMSSEPTDEEMDRPEVPDDLGGQFTEIFIKNSETITLLLSLLEEYDFHVRWPSVKLLTTLLTNRAKDIQEVILVCPMGVSKLMDILSDSREVIRNDALLLLVQLTKGNANIQKIVAFENAFDRLFEVISEEGFSDGGVVVEDCLMLLLSLLQNNVSNQNFFKEGSFIQRLAPFFELNQAAESQAGWSAQKVSNIHLMLQILRCLVSPSNPQKHNTSSQNLMNRCGLLQLLCTILMASGVPADVLTETINTVSEVIRGNQGNQEYFASVMAPSNPPRPAIVVLLMSMVNEKQPFVLRCSVLYCFESFLHKNVIGQSQIVQTLLPSTADVNTISAGQLLCGGLFSVDSLSTWFAASALLHAIIDNNTEKEQLLRVQLATSLGNPPISLLQQCTNILSQGAKFQTKIGILMLLCTWLSKCPVSVTHFLHSASNIPFLISQVSATEGDDQEQLVQGMCAFLLGICVLSNNEEVPDFNKASLRNVIEKRIGIEAFSDKVSRVTRHESYSRTAKGPQLYCKQPSDIIFDHAFTVLFKSLESDILKTVNPDATEKEEKEKQTRIEAHENIVTQYKEIIREQDLALNKLKGDFSDKSRALETADSELTELRQQIQQVKDQNSLLKAQKGFSNQGQTDAVCNDESTKLQQDLEESLRLEISQKNEHIEKLKQELTVSEARALVNNTNIDDEASDNLDHQAAIDTLSNKIQELQGALSERDKEITHLMQQHKLPDLGNQPLINDVYTKDSNVSELEAQISTLEVDNRQLKEDKSSLQERLRKSNEDVLNLEEKFQKSETEKQKLEEAKSQQDEEVKSIKKEQEDMLVFLADQDQKVDEYKKRLKELGEKVDDDEDDEDELEDDSDNNGDD